MQPDEQTIAQETKKNDNQRITFRRFWAKDLLRLAEKLTQKLLLLPLQHASTRARNCAKRDGSVEALTSRPWR